MFRLLCLGLFRAPPRLLLVKESVGRVVSPAGRIFAGTQSRWDWMEWAIHIPKVAACRRNLGLRDGIPLGFTPIPMGLCLSAQGCHAARGAALGDGGRDGAAHTS